MAGQKQRNHRLDALMREAGVSNKRLARMLRETSEADEGPTISPSHTSVDKWLSGETARPQDRTCRLIAKVLGYLLGRPLTPDDIGYPDVAPEGAGAALVFPDSVPDSITGLTQTTRFDLHPSDQSARLLVVPEAWSDLLVKIAYGGPVDAPVTDRHRVSTTDVQRVSQATAMFSRFDYEHGGGAPKPLVAQFLESDVLPLIAQVSPGSPHGADYFREVAALVRLAGWTAYDTGQHALAQRYMFPSFHLARASGDKALCGRVLAGMSHQAKFLGHLDEAVYLARAAAHGAAGFATPRAMALFKAMEARGTAAQGRERETTAALAEAEQWLGQANIQDDPEWIRYFDAAELHAEFAHCFRDLGQPQLAIRHATASINESESLYVRSLSFCRTVLATAHLQNNDLEQAVEVARGVTDTAAHLKSRRVVSYLQDFRGRLDGFQGSAHRSDFEDHFRLMLPFAA